MKEQDEALDKAVIEHYQLVEAEVKKIVVHNKWLASLEMLIAEANQAVLQNLTRRLKELAGGMRHLCLNYKTNRSIIR